jgi:hypothetical protein
MITNLLKNEYSNITDTKQLNKITINTYLL